MTKGIRTATLALAALAVLALAGTAAAAYTSPKLTVSYAAGGVTRIVASAAVADDATARAAIVIPNGTTVTTTAAAGTKVGVVQAQVSALALGGALLPLAGDIIVAPPGAVAVASQTACVGAVAPQATYLLVLQAAGQTLNLPAYVVPTASPFTALGSQQLVFCLPPPDVPVASGGATFGAKFLSADMTFTGVFGPVTQGAWVGIWVPYNPLVGTPNAAAVVSSPAAIAPGALSLTGKKVKGVKRLTGRVTQGGAGIAARVSILAGTKRIATVVAAANGSFAYAVPKAAKATSFQARVVVAGRDSPTVCGQFSALGFPCVNPTVSGFSAQSRTIRIR